jgi:hypothetical protein
MDLRARSYRQALAAIFAVPFALGSGALVAACASLPSITFEADDAATASDATFDAQADTSIITLSDAGADAPAIPDAADPPTDDDPPDAAGGVASIKCGNGKVAGCGACQGFPLRCTANGRDYCVSTCGECGELLFPCIHCPPNNPSALHGKCVGLNANGRVACTNANRCPCDGDAGQCPDLGAAQTCLVDPKGTGERCFTCGEPGTAQASCAHDGGGGTCRIAAIGAGGASGPTCK